MKIDLAQVRSCNPEREAKNTQLKKERCFRCKKQGHLKQDCSEWGKKGDKRPPYQSKGCVASTSTPTPNTAQPIEDKEPELKELAHYMHSLNDLGKEQLFDLIMDEDF